MQKILITGLLIFFLVGCTKPSEMETLANKTEPASVNVTTQEANPESVQAGPNPWEYDQSVDEMRGTKSKYAYLKSDNVVDFDFPYDGGSSLQISLRKNNNNPTDVMFSISKGQFSCNTITDSCYASIKFDNEAIQNIELAQTTDHSSDVFFISNQFDVNQFINDLKKSKKLIIELPFYQEGKKQFKFKLSQLNWDSPKQPKTNSQPIANTAEAAAMDAIPVSEAAKAAADIAIEAAASYDAETALEIEVE